MKYPVRAYIDSDLEELTGFLNLNLEFDTLSKDLLEDKLSGDPFWDPRKALLCHDENQIVFGCFGILVTVSKYIEIGQV